MSAEDTLRLRFPDFLCIGAQKAGTTWLDANLRRHSSVWMPWIKELQYFNDRHLPAHRAWTDRHRQRHAEAAVRRVVKGSVGTTLDLLTVHGIASLVAEPLSDEWYGRVFAHAPPERICGEITPEYGLLPDTGVAHVRRLCPTLKVIFLMRDPVARCWSHLRMLARGNEGLDFVATAGRADVLDRARYRAILARWREAFGEAAVFTARIEEVAENPETFLRAVVDFLGCPWDPAVAARAAEPVFVGPEASLPEAVRTRLLAALAEEQSAYWDIPVSWSPPRSGAVGTARA